MDRAGYRPEVDGLRALAVAVVLLFHLRFPYLGGGFVGVDVFFVISGYVITRLIYKEMQAGQFTFSGFYLRRVRRLFPALFVTLMATLIGGWLIYTEMPLRDLARSLTYAALSASNVLFWKQSGYFDTDATLKPLLHTWSLAVEEQFYIVWPALFIGLYALLKRRWAIIIAIVGIGLVSLAAAEFVLGNDPAQAFYLMPYRGSEFAIGAGLVLLENRHLTYNLVREALCIIGLALIAGAVVGYSEAMRFPGVSALLPCLGAALVIFGGSAKYIGLVLRNACTVWIGRISYSLYLVHWPLLTLYGYWRLDQLGVGERIGIAAVSLFLASAMYVFVEQPLRRPRSESASRPSSVFAVASAAAVVLVAASAGTIFYENRWAISSIFSSNAIHLGKSQRFALLKRCPILDRARCDFLPGKVNVLVVGDSMAVDAYNALATMFPGANVVLSSLGGCPPYDKMEMEHLLSADYPHRQECIEFNRKWFDPSYTSHFDLIAIDVLFGLYKPEHLERFLAALSRSSASTPVIVFGNYLQLSKECGLLAERYGVRACGDDEFISSRFLYEDQLKDLSARYGAIFLSEKDAFCPEGRCQFALGSVPFTWDQFHLSYEFAVKLGLRSREKVFEELIRREGDVYVSLVRLIAGLRRGETD